MVTFRNKAADIVTYRVNGGTEQTIASGATGTITLAAVGDKVQFFGDNTRYGNSDVAFDCSNISCTEDCYVYGNIMSLVKSDGFASEDTLTGNYSFACLFYNNAKIKNKTGYALLLPATTLSAYCYYSMFYGCSLITVAPDLPATVLKNSCYRQMFQECTSLASAPELPATTLESYCYMSMFQKCTSLTAAPELSAETLASNCYRTMFLGCTGLASAPALPATTLADDCYQSMFHGCTNLTSAPALPAETLAPYCYCGMFVDCTSLTSAPELPATTLPTYSYWHMFKGCSSLNSVTCLATDISAEGCTTDWLSGVASTGTFTKAAGIGVDTSGGWTSNSASGIPAGWTVEGGGAVTNATPLTIEADVAGAMVTFSNKASDSVTYKISDGTEGTIASGASKAITLSAGDTVQFFGDNTTYGTSGSANCSNISCSANCYIYGNIMSLVRSSGYESATTLTGSYTFAYLFNENANIKNKDGCDLFLPATTLADNCYMGMFFKCTGLTAAPALPATSLTTSCYNSMFYGCTSLKSVTCLATNISVTGCTNNWLNNVATGGTFYRAYGVAWSSGASGIPGSWIAEVYVGP